MHRTQNGLRINKAFLSRLVADIVFTNISLSAALIFRYLLKVSEVPQAANIQELNRAFLDFYYTGAPLLTALTALIFYAYGIYTRTRFYARKHKALILFQAVTVSYLLFILCFYLISRETSLIPRGVFVLSYVLTLALSGGTRLLTHLAIKRYDIVQRKGPAGNGIPRVLVVGGAGYIGSVFVRQLLEEGYTVRVLDAVIFGNSAVEDLRAHPRFELLEGDLRHAEAVVRAVKGSDAVVHMGAIVGDPACALDEQITRDINTIATRLIIQVCRGYGVRRLLFASTCAVYGASDHLMDERSALNPVSLYAQTKADAEAVVLAAASNDFCPTVLRLGTAFGHSYRPRFDLVVNLLAAKAYKERKIKIYNKDQWRPFVHIQDISRAFVMSLGAKAEIVRGQVFNVGSYNLNLTLGQVAQKIKAQFPETEVQYIETDDRRNYRVSFDKIHTFLGFNCAKTVEDGLAEIKKYLEEEQIEAFDDEIYDNSKRMKALSSIQSASGSDGVLQLIGQRAQESADD
jgi:nucleoside-diphosphate-sugar epimerase